MEDGSKALGEQERPAAVPLPRRDARQLVAPSAQEQQSASQSHVRKEWQHSVTGMIQSMMSFQHSTAASLEAPDICQHALEVPRCVRLLLGSLLSMQSLSLAMLHGSRRHLRIIRMRLACHTCVSSMRGFPLPGPSAARSRMASCSRALRLRMALLHSLAAAAASHCSCMRKNILCWQCWACRLPAARAAASLRATLPPLSGVATP